MTLPIMLELEPLEPRHVAQRREFDDALHRYLILRRIVFLPRILLVNHAAAGGVLCILGGIDWQISILITSLSTRNP